MTADALIFVPVGTSLLTNLGQEKDVYEGAETGYFDNTVKNLISTRQFFPSIKEVFGTTDNWYPAEVSSLYAFAQDPSYNRLTGKTKRVILLHSPDLSGKQGVNGRKVAELVQFILNKVLENDDWTFELEELTGLDPNDPAGFNQSIKKLFDIVHTEINNAPNAEIFINITGGYKAPLPFLTMIGMALGQKVRIFYLYEDSTQVIWLPPLPMAFDLLQWRDQRSLLLPFKLSRELVKPEQREKLAKALHGTRVATLLDDTQTGLNPMGNFLSKQYDEQKGGALTQFGSGYLLLDRFSNAHLREYLAKHCIPHWIHMSTGDHIPETVEHGRGHVQRLLELAQQVLLAADIQLTDEQLFVLIASIWLHDLGHTGDYFQYEGDGGLIKRNGNPSSQAKVFCYGDPDLVRKNHNLLTYQLIKDDEDRPEKERVIFPDGFPDGFSRHILVRSILLACLYHRRDMPKSGEKCIENIRIAKGIEDFLEKVEVIEGFGLVAALLRICDGAENQAERSGSPEYEKVMRWVIRRRVSAILDMPEFIDSLAALRQFKPKLFEKEGQVNTSKYVASFGWDAELAKRIQGIHSGEAFERYIRQLARLAIDAEFKARQPQHYQKHRMLQHTFVVSTNRSTLKNPQKNKGWFAGKKEEPLVGFYGIADKDYQQYDRNMVIKDILVSFIGEFLPVASLLPFSIAVFLIEGESLFQLVADELVTLQRYDKNLKWSMM